eukprot:sb/3472135/
MDAVDSSRTSADARSHFVAASTQLPSIPVHVPAPTTAPTVLLLSATTSVMGLPEVTKVTDRMQSRRRVMLRCRVVGWFILKDGTLTYYKDANTTDTGCRGSFKLEACNILVHPVDVLRLELHPTCSPFLSLSLLSLSLSPLSLCLSPSSLSLPPPPLSIYLYPYLSLSFNI